MRNRRFVLWPVILAIVLLATAACGAQPQTASSNQASAGDASKAAAPAPQLEPTLVFAFGGGTLEQALREQVLPLFEKQTGVKVTMAAGTAAQNFAKTQANKNNPPFDLVWTSEETHLQGKAAGVWQPLDPKVVTNLNNAYPEFRDPDNVGAPFGFVIIGLAYNSKIFADKGFKPPTSWQDLWNPAYKGHVGAYSWATAFSADFLVSLSKSLGGNEQNTTAALDRLKSLAPDIINVFPDPGSLDNSFIQGDTWIAYNSNARVLAQSQSGLPIKFVAPKEGATFHPVFLDTPVNAAHPNAARAFINFWLSPEVQRLMPKAVQYAPVVPNATIPSDLAEFIPSPDSRKQFLFVDRKVIVDRNQELSQLWDKVLQKP